MAHEELALQKIQDGQLSFNNKGNLFIHYRFHYNPKGSGFTKYFNPPKKMGYKDSWGYLGIAIWDGKKSRFMRIHRIAYLYFNGLSEFPDNFREINHINGDKTDNSPENLEFITRKENDKHSREVLGNTLEGSKNGKAKLTEGKVRNIIHLLKNHTCTYVAKKYKIGTTAIEKIKYGETWKHIPRDV